MKSLSAHQSPATRAAHRLLASLSVGLILMAPWSGFADGTEDQNELLRQNGIAAETAELIAYLQRLLPDPAKRVEVEALVAQLSNPDFAKREAAMGKLATSGEVGRDLIAEAKESDDLDLRLRCGRILGELDSDRQAELRRSLTLAALQLLRARHDPGAVPVLLETIALLDDPYVGDVAAEALWASANPMRIDILAPALDHPDKQVRAAAIVALEIAGGRVWSDGSRHCSRARSRRSAWPQRGH